jgi:hypothetical protein
MLGKPGPFQIIESEGSGNVDAPTAAPRRRYECLHYPTCLDLAAALNWDNFTCRGCSAEIDQALLWRAKQAEKRDNVARSLCHIPQIQLHEKSGEQPPAVESEGATLKPRVVELFRPTPKERARS